MNAHFLNNAGPPPPPSPSQDVRLGVFSEIQDLVHTTPTDKQHFRQWHIARKEVRHGLTINAGDMPDELLLYIFEQLCCNYTAVSAVTRVSKRVSGIGNCRLLPFPIHRSHTQPVWSCKSSVLVGIPPYPTKTNSALTQPGYSNARSFQNIKPQQNSPFRAPCLQWRLLVTTHGPLLRSMFDRFVGPFGNFSPTDRKHLRDRLNWNASRVS